VCCKAPSGDQAAPIAMDSEWFYRSNYLARYGWISPQLDPTTVDWKEDEEVVDGWTRY
jgi:hypothetical protein